MYVHYYRDRSSPAKLQEIIVKFYTEAEISAAKKLLIELYTEEMTGSELLTGRRSSTLRLAKEAEVEDIISFLDIVDRKNVLGKVKFAALAYDRLPRYGPEELNLSAIVDKQARTDDLLTEISSKINSLTSNSIPATVDVTQLNSAMERMDSELRSSTLNMQEQLNQLTEMCAKLAQPTVRHTTPSPSATPPVQDRSLNVIISGLDENRDSNTWKIKVMTILCVAAGRDVAISDAFRIGRFTAGKKRLVLVKLHSAWDRRLVLGGSGKLAEIEEFRGSVYLSADEPVEVRRKNAMDRLRARAEKCGHGVHVSENGVLLIDTVEVYSLNHGRLCVFNLNNGIA